MADHGIMTPFAGQAQVSVAMGTGTYVTMESAGVTLNRGRPTRYRASGASFAPHDRQYQAEPVIRVCPQRRQRAEGSGRPLPAAGEKKPVAALTGNGETQP